MGKVLIIITQTDTVCYKSISQAESNVALIYMTDIEFVFNNFDQAQKWFGRDAEYHARNAFFSWRRKWYKIKLSRFTTCVCSTWSGSYLSNNWSRGEGKVMWLCSRTSTSSSTLLSSIMLTGRTRRCCQCQCQACCCCSTFNFPVGTRFCCRIIAAPSIFKSYVKYSSFVIHLLLIIDIYSKTNAYKKFQKYCNLEQRGSERSRRY